MGVIMNDYHDKACYVQHLNHKWGFVLIAVAGSILIAQWLL